MQACRDRRARGAAVELDHGRDHGREILRRERAVLVRGREHARADRLREPQRVARAQPRFQEDRVRSHATGHGDAELGLPIDHRVASRDDSSRLGELVGRTLKEPLQLFEGKILRPGGDVEPEEDLAAHRVDVAHRVGRADGAGRVRVVDDGRKEIEGLDDRDVRRDEIDGRVVARLETDEQLLRCALFAHWTQDLRQRAGAQLGASAGAGRERR